MRTFTAAMLPDSAKTALGKLSRSLETVLPGRYALPGNMHCTLAFIGELEPSRVSDALTALTVAASGVPFMDARLKGLGFFGPRGNAILWHGIEGARELPDINARLVKELRSRGIHVDDARFNAHITLARKVDLSRVELWTLPSLDVAVRIDRLAVYESARINGVLRYTPLGTVALNG